MVDMIDNNEEVNADENNWIQCWKCEGEGVFGHDCGEDCCCCPYLNLA